MPRIDLPSVGLGRPPLRPNELVWVTATSALILFLSFTPQLFVIWPYFLRTPTFTFKQLLWALLPFNAGIVAIFYNYHLCISTSPGRVPRDWEPDWDALGLDSPEIDVASADDYHDLPNGSPSSSSCSDDEVIFQPQQRKDKKKHANPLAVPRFCRTCKSYKPPRAHHCKHCKMCTLKMDHHCPWIANCIGHANAPHFLRFLYAVEYSILYHFALISARIADWWSPPGAFWSPPGNAEMVLILLNYIGGIIVLLLISIFCIYHTWLLCNGTTTIESSERDRVRTMVRRGRIREIRYPFDLGIYANVCAVLGPTPLHWLVPGLRTQYGSGLMYPCCPGTPSWLPYAWPPRDPTHPTHSSHRIGGRSNGESVRAQRRRTELEQGWEWERNRMEQDEAFASGNAFTYGHGQLNPALLPSSAQQRRALASEEGLRTRVRRGSEGYEVQPKRFDRVFAYEEYAREAAYRERPPGADAAEELSPGSPTQDLMVADLPAAFNHDEVDDDASENRYLSASLAQDNKRSSIGGAIGAPKHSSDNGELGLLLHASSSSSSYHNDDDEDDDGD